MVRHYTVYGIIILSFSSGTFNIITYHYSEIWLNCEDFEQIQQFNLRPTHNSVILLCCDKSILHIDLIPRIRKTSYRCYIVRDHETAFDLLCMCTYTYGCYQNGAFMQHSKGIYTPYNIQ